MKQNTYLVQCSANSEIQQSVHIKAEYYSVSGDFVSFYNEKSHIPVATFCRPRYVKMLDES